MTLAEINTKITELTGYSTDRYPNANRLINLNLWLDKMGTMISESQDEDDYDDPNRGDFPIYDDDLVAGQQDYAYPSQLFDVKRVEVKLDGTNTRRATPVDINQLSRATTSAEIAQTFNTDNPYYDTQYGSVFLYPIPQINVTDGITVWGTRNPKPFTLSDLTTGTLVPGIQRAFIPMLAYGAAHEVAQPDRLPNLGDIIENLKDYEARLKRHYGKRNKDRAYRLDAPNINYE